MNMSEVIKGKIMEEARIWETFNCKDIEEIIKGNLRTIDEKFAQITASFVTNGYYLRRQYDEKMYEAEGYDSFEEYVKAVYGKSRSWAKRMMQINEKFSVGGNDPRIDSKYIEYSVSQLQEMLYLEEDQLEHITPDMTIKEIREVRKPEEKLSKPNQEQTEYLNTFARHFIVNKHDWLLQDFQSRVMHVDKSPNEIKKNLGAEHRTWYFATDDGTAHINLFDNYVQLWDERSVCLGDFDWFYLAAAIQRMWNIVAMENAQKKQETDAKCATSHKSGVCIHRPEYACTLPEASKLAVGDGIDCNKKCCWDCLKRMECGYRCNGAAGHPIEEAQIPGRMNVEDYPELLPEPEETGINTGNDEDNVIIEHPEIVINQPESVIDEEENVIDAEYKEIAAENVETDEICCQEAADLDELTFSQIAIRDYLEEEERKLAEYVECDQKEKGFPQRLLQKQQMLVKALRLLMEHEADQDSTDEPENLEELETVQPELPLLKNNDQRKEWLNNYKEWGLWYRDEHIDVNYYKYDFSDGSRLVVAEYPQRRMYWKANEFADEHYYHLLDKHREWYGTDKTFEQQYAHSTDSETNLVEFLKNLQKGEKK